MPEWNDHFEMPDISHLHEGDRNRIQAGQYDARELGLLLKGQNPWTRSGKPEPLKPKDKKPEQGDLPLHSGTRVPAQTADDKTIPFANPSERQLRHERMQRDIYIHGHPDPKDVAAEEAAELRYQYELAQERQRQRKKLESEFAPPKKAIPVPTKPQRAEIIGTDRARIVHRPAEEPDGKLSAFIDSNLTWGSFGVIVAGLATLVSSAVLLAFGWAMLTVSLYRHFFKGKSWAWQIFGTMFVALMLGVALLVIWLSFRPT